ncbi:uncharacterized protein LOC131680445 [Topomyia yanbarensis]|uniref:uncharacterized protein LOC131680445 n=1 Tax=Topomyia yanbarensis TaxID=2498891 RepID=UPI00273C9819|nr:uncharacterized protein LOC131680445 [Topomyia yanbarensis]
MSHIFERYLLRVYFSSKTAVAEEDHKHYHHWLACAFLQLVRILQSQNATIACTFLAWCWSTGTKTIEVCNAYCNVTYFVCNNRFIGSRILCKTIQVQVTIRLLRLRLMKFIWKNAFGVCNHFYMYNN